MEFMKRNARKPQGKGKWTPSFQTLAKKGGKCEYCGYSSHPRSECSAKCNSCGKVGHYDLWFKKLNQGTYLGVCLGRARIRR